MFNNASAGNALSQKKNSQTSLITSNGTLPKTEFTYNSMNNKL